jgi:hypothetical protein
MDCGHSTGFVGTAGHEQSKDYRHLKKLQLVSVAAG